MFPLSNFLCVDHVVLAMRPDETDVNNPVGIARKIEHHAAVLEDTRAADSPLHACRRRPVCCLDLPIPSHQWLACISIGRASIEEALERTKLAIYPYR
jgi:hypothetical protein